MAWDLLIRSSGFKSPYRLPARKIIKLTKANLAWAALTVGRPDKDAVMAHGQWSRNEALFRWHMVLANIDFSSGSRSLNYSPAFNALDSSEKRGINFFIGMMMAKLVAQKQLQIPWLHHVENFDDGKTIKFGQGKSRPDFLGKRPTDASWHVVEAKARLKNGFESALEAAKRQASNVSSIHGAPPATRIATLLYPEARGLCFKWVDPDGVDDGIKLTETPAVWRSYYRLPWALHSLADEDKAIFEKISGLRVSITPAIASAIKELVEGKKGSAWQAARDKLINWSIDRSVVQGRDDSAGDPRQFLAADGVHIFVNDEAGP